MNPALDAVADALEAEHYEAGPPAPVTRLEPADERMRADLAQLVTLVRRAVDFV